MNENRKLRQGATSFLDEASEPLGCAVDDGIGDSSASAEEEIEQMKGCTESNNKPRLASSCKEIMVCECHGRTCSGLSGTSPLT